MGIPAYTRIIVMSSDERTSREYGISRPVVLMLLLLAAVFIGFMALLMHSFATKQARQI